MINIYESLIKKLEVQEATVKSLAQTALELRAAQNGPLLAKPSNITAQFDAYKTTRKSIEEFVFEESPILNSTDQLELIDRLLRKVELAMEIVELQAVLQSRRLNGFEQKEIDKTIDMDAKEVTVLRYQYRRACNNYIHDPHRLFELDKEQASAEEASIRQKQYQFGLGVKNPKLLDLPDETLLSKLGTARLGFANMSIAEGNIHLEGAQSKINNAYLLIKGFDEGILPHSSQSYITHLVLESLDQAELILSDCNDRAESTRRFLGQVYEMMGKSNSHDFIADRYAAAPLQTINKITP